MKLINSAINSTSCATRRYPGDKKVFGQKIDLYSTYNNISHSNFQTMYHKRSISCSWNDLGEKKQLCRF